MQEAEIARLAAASLMTLVAPTWDVSPGWTSELYVLNNFSQEIDLEVEILDSGGRPVAATVLPVAPARHEALALSSLVEAASGVVRNGSLRVRFSGDKDMIQAWMVLSGPDGVTERVLKNVTADGERALTTFWDLRGLHAGRVEAEYFLVNGGSRPLTFSILGAGPRADRLLATQVLLPGQKATWSPLTSATAVAFGWVEIQHDGEPGSLAVGGLLRGDRLFSNLPIFSPEDRTVGAEHHAVRLPFLPEIATGTGDAKLTMANTAQQAQQTTVALVEAETGWPLVHESIELKAGAVTTVDLGRLLQGGFRPGTSAARLVVRGEHPGLLVDGRVRSFLTGETVELAFFARDQAHGNGSYPLPDPERFRVTTTLVNVGEEDSRVVGQVSWADGTYAMEPLIVPAGTSRTIDFGAIAGTGDEDRLGRSVPSVYRAGFFRWTVQGGGRDVIARTEARPLEGEDTFGFNCFGCCSEWSRGAMIPTSTTFPYYASGALEGVEFIDTCSGPMGPFSLYNPSYSYNSPLAWNGVAVSASAPSAQDVSFSATGHKIMITTCSEVPITIVGIAPATATKVTVLDVSLPDDRIRLRLEPANRSGNLKVYLTGGSSRTLVNTTYGSGDHVISFGNLGTYTTGQTFSRVVAEWTVNGKLATGSVNYGFEVLGSYNHTRYNTPNDALCSGSSISVCYFTGNCINVNSCTSYGMVNGHSDWISEVGQNGSGYHSQLGFVSMEYFCAKPGGCAYVFRQVPQPCPTCSGQALTVDGTVAIKPGHMRLSCGSRVYIDGVGMRTVTDRGGGLADTQLDHYSGVSGCNAVTSIGYRMTFKLN